MYDFSWLFRAIPYGVFTTIYFDGKEYGEVDPVFVEEFGLQLGASWKIFDSEGRSLAVSFNKSYLNPLLMGGWSRMPSVFDFRGDRVLSFFYYGDDLFGPAFKEPLVSYSRIPIYHSRFQQLSYTAHLCIRLTNELVLQPYLFEDYLRRLEDPYFTVCCDNGSVTAFDIAFTDEPFKITAI
ncbi:hypothetical protein A2U01_0004349 [Trifolium medium]|uniref:Uncharacterized protein n=1 Tax=Trifolium medium TaxID=97028 RepID=A0A392MBB3_9FABA|nr:hypothetical protein [Trifolium medium]